MKWLVGIVVAAVVVPLGLILLTLSSSTPGSDEACLAGQIAVGAVGGLNASQRAIAETAMTQGEVMSVPAAGWVVELAAGLVESHLTNLDHGDRDSLGWLQQRTSQGWGTPAQIMDVAYAARSFYTHLLAVPGWESMQPGAAAQAVQASAFPDAYAAQVPLAQAIVAAASTGQPGAGACAPVGAAGTDTVLSPRSAGGPIDTYHVPIPAGPAGAAIRAAFTMIGKPYDNRRDQFNYFTTQNPPYLDCSGLTLWAVWWGAHVSLASNAAGQWASLPHVAWAKRSPGDLILYEGDPPGHVAMYLGDFAGPDGIVRNYQIAATTFGQPLRIQPVWSPMTGVARWTSA